MKIGSLFSGIGGLELGLERAGVGETIWQVESDSFARRVLEKHWPHAQRYDDVCNVGAHNLEPVDLICGGFPCQDLSRARRSDGGGLEGPRSGLWGEFARIIGDLEPAVVVVENIHHGWRRWVPAVREELATRGYHSIPLQLSAAEVGAWHLRRRAFVVAHADSEPLRVLARRWRGPRREDTPQPRDPRWGTRGASEPRGGDGLPGDLDRCRALGNAVVPQVGEAIGRAMLEAL